MKFATLRTRGTGATSLYVQTPDGFASVEEWALAAGREHLRGLRDVADLYARGAGAVDDVRELSRDAVTTVLTKDAIFAPPVVRPSKIICVGLNYLDHITESGGARPANIVLFPKFSSCLVGHEEAVRRPASTQQLDYEGELAVVIGRRTSGVSVDDALGAVGGYTIMNDVSARDLQVAEPQWIRGKCLDTFAPLGPVVLDAPSVPPIAQMRIRTVVNGEVRQDESCAMMITPVAELIAHISASITLEPGDVIATGTPSGVGLGMNPPTYLRAGDVVSISIDAIGELTNTIVDV